MSMSWGTGEPGYEPARRGGDSRLGRERLRQSGEFATHIRQRSPESTLLAAALCCLSATARTGRRGARRKNENSPMYSKVNYITAVNYIIAIKTGCPYCLARPAHCCYWLIRGFLSPLGHFSPAFPAFPGTSFPLEALPDTTVSCQWPSWDVQ